MKHQYLKSLSSILHQLVRKINNEATSIPPAHLFIGFSGVSFVFHQLQKCMP